MNGNHNGATDVTIVTGCTHVASHTVELENTEESGDTDRYPVSGISVELAKLTTLAAVAAERDAYLRQLTVVQAECTRLTLVNRAMRQDLVPLAERLVEARSKHPEGTEVVDAMAEIDEMSYAQQNESEWRFRYEALDAAVCLFRVFLGGDPQ